MFYITLIIFILILDQWSKRLVIKHVKSMRSYVVIPRVFHLTYMENTGAAYSIFSDKLRFLIPFSVVSLTVFGVVFLRNLPKACLSLNMAMSFIIGGALGNLVDRIRLGYVVDFLDIKKKYLAVFNVADFFILMGTIVLCYLIVFQNIELM